LIHTNNVAFLSVSCFVLPLTKNNERNDIYSIPLPVSTKSMAAEAIAGEVKGLHYRHLG